MDIFASNGSSAHEENEGSTHETVGDVPNPIESTDGPLSKLEMPDSHREEYLQDQQKSKKEENKQEQQNTNKEEAKKVTEDQKIPSQPAWLQAVKSAWNYAWNVPLIGPYRKIYLEELQKSKEEETKQKQQNSNKAETKKATEDSLSTDEVLARVKTIVKQTASKEVNSSVIFNGVAQACLLATTFFSAWQYRLYDSVQRIRLYDSVQRIRLGENIQIGTYFSLPPSFWLGVCIVSTASIGLFNIYNAPHVNLLYQKIKSKVSNALKNNILSAVKKCKISYLETDEYAKEIVTVARNEYRLAELVRGKIDGIRNGVNFAISMAAFSWFAWLNLDLKQTGLTLFFLFTSSFLQWKHTKRYADNIERIAEKNAEEIKKNEYNNWIFIDPQIAKQDRILGTEEFLQDEINQGNQKLSDDNINAEIRNTSQQFISKLFSLSTVGACAFSYIIAKGLWGNLAPEKLIMTSSALFSLYTSTVSLIENSGRRLENLKFVSKAMNFIARAEKAYEEDIKKRTESVDCSKKAPVIEAKDLTFKYNQDDDHAAVKNVNCTIEPGKIVVIVGPSGSGKTTLLKLLMNIYSATPPKKDNEEADGEETSQEETDFKGILFGGHDINKVNLKDIYSNIAYAGQGCKLHNHKTIRENIEFGRRPGEEDSGVSLEEAIELAQCKGFIDEKGLDTMIGLESKGGTALSLGEEARLFLARAFIRNAKIMLFDEPTANLDAENEEAIFQAFKKLKREDRTIIVVTHDIKRAAEVADTLIVMEDNTMGAIGTHEEVLKNSQWYRRAYLGEYE